MKYVYIVVTKDTSLTKMNSILCIAQTKKEADEYMNPARAMYQYDLENKTYGQVLY